MGAAGDAGGEQAGAEAVVNVEDGYSRGARVEHRQQGGDGGAYGYAARLGNPADFVVGPGQPVFEARAKIRCRTGDADRRQVIVSLSEKGKQTLLADRKRRDAWLATRLKQLSPEERDVLRQAAPILEALSQL